MPLQHLQQCSPYQRSTVVLDVSSGLLGPHQLVCDGQAGDLVECGIEWYSRAAYPVDPVVVGKDLPVWW